MSDANPKVHKVEARRLKIAKTREGVKRVTFCLYVLQAGFTFGTTAYMCFMFAVTTPMGIVLGMILFSVTGYDDSSPNALILEGLLGSFSSGILIYMALVDLIALDLFHNKMMTSNSWLRKTSFTALVLGSISMSILALWA